MSDNTPKKPQPLPVHSMIEDREAAVGEVALLFGQPVIRGATHHTQSITPIRHETPPPIRKRRSRDWWKKD